MALTRQMVGDDDGTYYVIDNSGPGGDGGVCWLGIHPRRTWGHVFWGTTYNDGQMVTGVQGQFWDLPLGVVDNTGTLDVAWTMTDGQLRLDVRSHTGLFGLKSLVERADAPVPPMAPTGTEPTGPGITGVWVSNAGEWYYVKQRGADVVWFATRPDLSIAHLFRGVITGDVIDGTYRDFHGTDIGSTDAVGRLTVTLDGDALTRTAAVDAANGKPVPFDATTWTRFTA